MWQGAEGSLQLTISKEAVGPTGHKEPNLANNHVSVDGSSPAQPSDETRTQATLWVQLCEETLKEGTKRSYAQIPDSQKQRDEEECALFELLSLWQYC